MVAAKAAKKPAPKKVNAGKNVKKTQGGKKKKEHINYYIECKNPSEDGIFKTQNFEAFLKDRIKVEGKTKQLELHGVTVSSTRTKIVVSSEKAFSKRYLKYLTKKYLKSNGLRDWLRVVSSDKSTYELRYFQITQDNDDEEENDS